MKIGILGAGQLARMLAIAGYPLGCTFRFYDTKSDGPCRELGETVTGAFDDTAKLEQFAAGCDVITYEFENVPNLTAKVLAAKVPVYPPPHSLEVSQDRVAEKTFFNALGIRTPKFAAALSAEELDAAIDDIGVPCVVKTTRFGYDGKGQAVVRVAADRENLWDLLGARPLIVEAFVPFSRELSIIACRSARGEVATYPLAWNIHRQGILYRSESPAPNVSESTTREAEQIASRILHELTYVGTVCVELFDTPEGLVANEMAPRVHNSGHGTIEGNTTSQFENHVRAVSGMQLGSTAARGRTVMYNLIGTTPELSSLTAQPRMKVHLYGKEPRAGRKLGHVTIVDPTADELLWIEQAIGSAPN